ncbi:MAG TPA: hypothetical protein VGH27_20490 [Streptosporangiaceae bacterium]
MSVATSTTQGSAHSTATHPAATHPAAGISLAPQAPAVEVTSQGRLRRSWRGLRAAIQEMNYASRRSYELNARPGR